MFSEHRWAEIDLFWPIAERYGGVERRAATVRRPTSAYGASSIHAKEYNLQEEHYNVGEQKDGYAEHNSIVSRNHLDHRFKQCDQCSEQQLNISK